MVGGAPKRWLITGVSTGLGRELLQAALARGDLVAGTLRDMRGAREIEALAPGRAFVFELHLEDAARAGAAVDEALGALGGGVDIVVNNAAFSIYGPVEACSDQDFQRVMDVNFFGLLRVTRACLPHLRRSRGTLVNMSSISGLVGHAGTSVYNVSKFAVEGLSEALAEELEPLGVKVMVVNPDRFKSAFFADRAEHMRSDAGGVYAGTPAGDVAQRLNDYVGNEPGDPAKLAAVVLQALDAAHPPRNLLVGPYGYVSVQAKIDRLAADMETWRAIATATSFGE
jgi:NAD(P)-dependent dehydrogenase (short-subunit alcohol dehydrogenase family)